MMPVDEETLLAATADLDLFARRDQIPHKTPEYFRNRYMRHPLYRYLTFVLQAGGRAVGLLAARVSTDSEETHYPTGDRGGWGQTSA